MGAPGAESGAAPLGAPTGVSVSRTPPLPSYPSRRDRDLIPRTSEPRTFSTPRPSPDGPSTPVDRLNRPRVDSVVSPSAFFQRIRIWSVNVRRFLKRRAELEARLMNSDVHILMLQETWLSDNVESITIPGFHLVGRLDRLLGPKRGYGGIAILARDSLTNIALLEYVGGAERMWCILHTHVGALLLGNWYRPPDETGESMDTLVDEMRRLRPECVGVILVGDVNIHHKKWLKYSRENSTLGERLWGICRETGLKQCVRDPTRQKYLLDLVMSDVSEWLKV